MLRDVLTWPLDRHPSGCPPVNTPTSAAALRRVLVGQYGELKRRLGRRLGSEDLAAEALHDAYLHLDHFPHQGIVNNPRQYLLTMATNIARMASRRERRWTSLEDTDAVSDVADESPDPLRSLAARQEVEALRQAFDALTPRRKRILLASRVEGVHLRDLAVEFGLSQRMVEKELKAALTLCGDKLGRDIVQRFGPLYHPSRRRCRASSG
jgi:RNA polymerase sigma-70 factor (ECF subfamily)